MPRPDLFNGNCIRVLLEDPRSPFLERDLRQLRTKLIRAEAAALMASVRHAVTRGLKRMAGRPARGPARPAPRAVAT